MPPGNREAKSTAECRNVCALVPETSEVQWVFPAYWLPFLYVLQECLQEASVTGQEAQPSWPASPTAIESGECKISVNIL